MRRELLDLHRALVDSERREYERARGRVSDRAFLEALIGAPELAWLNPLTSLIVRLEEVLEESAAEAAVQDCVREIRKLLRPAAQGQGFQRKYAEAMQRSPEVVVAHGRAIGALPDSF
jgi:type VI protein secretion system component VasF